MIYCRRYGDRYQIKAAQSEIQVNDSFCCITDLVFVNVQSATAQTLPKIIAGKRLQARVTTLASSLSVTMRKVYSASLAHFTNAPAKLRDSSLLKGKHHLPRTKKLENTKLFLHDDSKKACRIRKLQKTTLVSLVGGNISEV